jgi:hypothetical protein
MKRVEAWFEEEGEDGIHPNDTKHTEQADYSESMEEADSPEGAERTGQADDPESAEAGAREGKAKAVKSRKGAGGPKTAAGKARSAMNAVKHGLAARTPVLPGEDRGEFHEFAREHFEYLKPVGPIEKTIAHRLAVTAWRSSVTKFL